MAMRWLKLIVLGVVVAILPFAQALENKQPIDWPVVLMMWAFMYSLLGIAALFYWNAARKLI